MNLQRICTVFFSPTGETERTARILAHALAQTLHLEQMQIDLTPAAARKQHYDFSPNELVIVASPVYAGRIPNKIAPDFAAHLHGDHTPVIPLTVFGNRSPGDSLRELALLLEANGFVTMAAASTVSRHAFSDAVGAGRPGHNDWIELECFAQKIAARLNALTPTPLAFDRDTPIAPYYTPLKEDGTPAKFLKATPQRTADCTACGACATLCPMGSIDPETFDVDGICIKCQACVRGCPHHARVFTDEAFLSHVRMLEQNYTSQAKNQFYV